MIFQNLLRDFANIETTRSLDRFLRHPDRKAITIAGLAGSAKALPIAHSFMIAGRPILVISAGPEEAESLNDDLRGFIGDENLGHFPSWGIAPYEIRAPHADVVGQRIRALSQLGQSRPVVITASVEAVMEPTIDQVTLAENNLRLKVGTAVDPAALTNLLDRLCFVRRPMTEAIGEYSVRGGIIDFFSPTHDDPIRVEFFGDEIVSIRTFSVLTQKSSARIAEAHVLPRREFLLDQKSLDRLSHELPEKKAQALHVALGDYGDYDGLEFVWPLLNDRRSSIFGHLPEKAIVIVDEPGLVFQQVSAYGASAKARFEMVGEFPAAPPEKIYFDENFLQSAVDDYQSIKLKPAGDAGAADLTYRTLPQENFGSNLIHIKKRLKEMHQEGFRITILCETASHKQSLEELVDREETQVDFHLGRLTAGFALLDLRRWYLVDHQLFARHRPRRSPRRFREGVALANYASLNAGDYVVHVDFGIGRFDGLQTLVVDGRKRDCLALSYAGDDRLYVPVEEFHRVQKYAGKDGEPRLSKLGTATWEKTKARARKAVLEMAGELISLYAERQAFPGFAAKPDGEWQHRLEASFPYEETADQLKAMDDIRTDMEKPVPMDRLICGDVGYGKTELAIRAALKAVDSGKQAAVLVPTTILAAQHMATFTERLAEFPVKIALLSRFCTPKQAKETKAGLASGTIDIVIGTHMLLQKNIKFKDLGLLIIDEEHRFGVSHKEKLKKFRSQIDVLTLTATPIPRTMQLAFAGARDMSVINTPPQNRLPIVTEVAPFSDRLIIEAVNRELARNGQIYVVYNRVQSIDAFYKYLKSLLPLVRIAVAHGQMSERNLEKIMKDFYNKKYDLLLSTTIIESGLDIPTVNTLIVVRADRLGLAQLYQLRGRVGRSDLRAYAYLLIPPLKLLNRQARKRLKAIEEFTELGSGFHLAMRDLEIRGAGNLLGRQQHGFIEEVGFDLYIRLLEEAVAQLKGKSLEEHLADVKISTDLDLFLPENYIADSLQRVDVYRRFSAAAEQSSVDDLLLELEDRYGPPPESVANLAAVAVIRQLARKLGVVSLELKGAKMIMEFSERAGFDRSHIQKWVKAIYHPIEFKFDGALTMCVTLPEAESRSTEAKNVLQKMVG